ncbi:MAG: hypothetical protein V4615_07980 [Bacteroidota bacterium]
MKRAIAVLFLAAGFMLASAQAPDEVRTVFEKTHPNAKVTWKLENGYWNAYYTDTKTTTTRTVGYDKSGKKMYDRTQVTSKDVPAGVKTYYTTTYPDVKEYKVWYEDMNGNLKYFTDYGNNRLYFNDKGEFIESKPIN